MACFATWRRLNLTGRGGGCFRASGRSSWCDLMVRVKLHTRSTLGHFPRSKLHHRTNPATYNRSFANSRFARLLADWYPVSDIHST